MFVGLLVALALPASALAKTRTLAPPGNSGIGQYVEVVPTASGSQPTSTLHPATGAHGGALPPGGGSSGGGSGGGASAVSVATAKALASHGPDGVAAASLARATAPAIHRPSNGTAAATTSGSAPRAGSGSSPASSVFRALTGSSAGGGLGPILPIVLIVSVLGGGALALRRRRTT